MKKIVLIDDDATTNFLNKLIIEKSNLVDEVLTFDSGQDALNFFNSEKNEEDEMLVLLDINMPVMNGWQFLDHYETLNKSSSKKIVILTSSINPTDRQLAEGKKEILEYKSKPLSMDMLSDLVDEYLN